MTKSIGFNKLLAEIRAIKGLTDEDRAVNDTYLARHLYT